MSRTCARLFATDALKNLPKNKWFQTFENNSERETRALIKQIDDSHIMNNMQIDADSLLDRFQRKQADVERWHCGHNNPNTKVETTPFLALRALAKTLGVRRAFVKDEGQRMGLKAFKGLGVGFAVSEAIKRAGGPDHFFTNGDPSQTTLTTMTDGNHGRAVAQVARKLGCNCIIYVPESMVKERKMAIESEGAKVVVVRGSYDDAIAEVKDHCNRLGHHLISDSAWTGYEDIPSDICAGYGTIFREVERQVQQNWTPGTVPRPITHLFLQCGVGGFASAGVAYAFWNSTRWRGKSEAWDAELKTICVEPTDADCILENARIHCGVQSDAFQLPKIDADTGLHFCQGKTESIMAGLNCGVPSTTAWPILRDFCDAYIAVGDGYAKQGVRILAEEGVVAGESGAAGVAGALACTRELRDAIGLTPDSVVLFVNTEADTDLEMYTKILKGEL